MLKRRFISTVWSAVHTPPSRQMPFSNFSSVELTGAEKKPKRPYSFPRLHLPWEDFVLLYICVVSVFGCCLVLNFRTEVTSNPRDKDLRSLTSSLWHLSRRVYIVFFIGKGTFASWVLKMEWKRYLSLWRRRIIGARMHIIIQDGGIENLLCQTFCSKITPALQATITLLFWKNFFDWHCKLSRPPFG